MRKDCLLFEAKSVLPRGGEKMRRFPHTRKSAIWWKLPEVLREILQELQGQPYRSYRDVKGKLDATGIEYLAKLRGEIPEYVRIRIPEPEGREVDFYFEFHVTRRGRR
jgi:hypothetical protein